MANRKNTFLLKRSSVAGKVPIAGDLLLGELALNTADNILYASGTTANTILPIGWDRVHRTGDTMTGTLYTPSISATTYFGNGSNLTGIVATWDGLQVITVGENVDTGDLLFLSGNGKYYKVNNLSESTSSTELRISISPITADSSGNGLIQGIFTTTGLTTGAKYWVGNSGNYTISQPTSDNSIVRFIGTALSTTELEFNPDQTYIEISSVPAVPSTGSTNPSIRSVTTSQTLLENDETIICLSGLTITLPTAVGVDGKIYEIKSLSSVLVLINTTSDETIDIDETPALSYKQKIRIQSDGNNWIIL